jgi:citrate synthase
MTQKEASAALGVRQQTLYAYVSRGRIEVCPNPTDPRRSLYRAEDIATLLRKRDLGRARDSIAASTMSWGEPIIATRISTIFHGRLYYRGHDAVTLASTATLEEAAKLLWDIEKTPHFPVCDIVPQHELPRARAYAALGIAAAESAPAHALSTATLRQEAAALVGRLASAFVNLSPGEAALHLRMARAWNCAEHAGLLRHAMVLLADQELTSSSFAARIAASTGASLGACALAGLAALSGTLHGDATVRVQVLLEEVQRSSAEVAVRRWLAGGLALPGFGHELYPDGDPRAAALLAAFAPSESIRTLVECVHSLTGLRPTIDVALAALVEHCHLPEGAAFVLFATGRSVGWMAHAIEQTGIGSLLRPRARYVGPHFVQAKAGQD